MTTYVFSWDGKESWPLMPDTEFMITNYSKRIEGKSVMQWYVYMNNPSRVGGDCRQLCVRVCDTEEQAIKELRECVEKILCKDSGVDTPSPYGALTDTYARR